MPCPHPNCNRNSYTDLDPNETKCIFHAEKKDAQEFRDALAKLIWGWYRSKAKVWDFSGFVFVDRELPKLKVERTYNASPNLFAHARFTGNAVFFRATFTGDASFYSAAFSGNATFHSTKFSKDAYFRNTTFNRNASFNSTTYGGGAYFRNTTFNRNASFNSTTYGGGAFFKNAMFSGTASFNGAKISGNASFKNVMFTGSVAFHNATINGNSYFQSAKFGGKANFQSANFNGTASFVSASFDDASFRRATFSGNSYFLSATFKNVNYESVAFAGTSFKGASFNDAFFRSATFSGNAHFNSATFSGIAFFRSATFSKDADFRSATINGDASFHSTMFSKDASFNSAIFKRYADLQNATFTQNASFQGATFMRYAYFKSARINSSLNMMYCSFAVLGDFSTVVIGGAVRLEWPGEGYKQTVVTAGETAAKMERGRLLLKNLQFIRAADGTEPTLDLRNNPLQDDSKLRIHDCPMERILLARTDCREIEFQGVTWPEIDGRWVTGDEYVWQKLPEIARELDEDENRIKFNWNYIQKTYQEIAKRYREDLNHPFANDFDRGIFVARRENAREKGKWGDLVLMTLYRWVSNYGGSLWRPVLWLLLTFPVFAVLYYRTSLSPEVDPFWTNALSVAFRVATFRSGVLQSLELNHVGVYILAALQIALSATLISMFIFAVRRRFRH